MIKLDRMALADCFSPEELVDKIYSSNRHLSPPIPLDDIALEAGIIKISTIDTSDVEGILIADEGKEYGVIQYRQSGVVGRERFTIGHELGHFLLLHHNGRQHCSSKDLAIFNGSKGKHERLEAEANCFAADLIMPAQFVSRDINSEAPNLGRLIYLAELYQTSFEAMANRCASKSEHPFCLVYFKDRVIRYIWRDFDLFPQKVKVEKGGVMPGESNLVQHEGVNKVSHEYYVDAQVWLEHSRFSALPNRIIEQVYLQDNGYKVVMLKIVD